MIDLSRCVKCGSITGNSRKENHLRVAVFEMSQPIYLKSLLWDQYFCNLPKKSKSCWNDPMILKGTFMLESPYFLLFRQFPLFRQLDHSIVVPQKLDISDFRGIKYNDATTNSYQFVGAINFEGNSTTTGHYVAY